jgi:hypothetical protein
MSPNHKPAFEHQTGQLSEISWVALPRVNSASDGGIRPRHRLSVPLTGHTITLCNQLIRASSHASGPSLNDLNVEVEQDAGIIPGHGVVRAVHTLKRLERRPLDRRIPVTRSATRCGLGASALVHRSRGTVGWDAQKESQLRCSWLRGALGGAPRPEGRLGQVRTYGRSGRNWFHSSRVRLRSASVHAWRIHMLMSGSHSRSV